jgi:molybdopterin-guanine dinucleotide biosynthesis protein B
MVSDPLTLRSDLPVLQVVGYKNSGKTTLIEQIIAHLKRRFQLKIGAIKHDSHNFAMDREGTDTWRHRAAGAAATVLQSSGQLGFTAGQAAEKPLDELIALIRQITPCDFILVEGFKQERHPKIVMIRTEEDLPLLASLSNIAAAVFHHEKILQEAARSGIAQRSAFQTGYDLRERTAGRMRTNPGQAGASGETAVQRAVPAAFFIAETKKILRFAEQFAMIDKRMI